MGSANWPVAVVFIGDPEQRLHIDPAAVQDLYGLTRAEAAVASLVGEGWSIVEAANFLGVQTNTARVQLKQVYAKTGAHRQAALVHLIMTGPAHLSLV